MWTLILWVLCLQLVHASWNTFYSFLDGKVYLQLTNNDLVALNFSITGFDSISGGYLLSEINLQDGQSVSLLTGPPTNSLVFLYDSTLYAFAGSTDTTSDYDVCGDGVFQLVQYDSASDSWVSLADNMTFSDVADVSFYQDSAYLVSPLSSSIYIYGGRCSSSGTVTNRLLSFDMDTKSFANITTSTKPAAFYGAASLWAPNPQNSLVIGGKAAQGWLSMSQLAEWNFDLGWLSQTVSSNSSLVLLRINALALPVFEPLSDSSTATFVKSYQPSAVVVVGGDLSALASPQWAKLALNSNEWTWSSLDTSIDVADVLGAAVIFDTLVVINLTSVKRDGASAYLVSLYDLLDNFAAVLDVRSSTQNSTSTTSTGTTTTTKVLVGTLVPLAAIAVVVAAGFMWWKRKLQKDEPGSILEPDDYQLGHFRTASEQPYSLLGANPLNYIHDNDSASTLDAASMDSWVRKRQEYDAKRFRTLKRHSFLALNETLNSHLEVSDEPPALPSPPQPEMVEVDMGSPNDERAVPPRVSVLCKSFSYSHTPPALPMLRKKSRLDPGFLDAGDLGHTPEYVEVSDESCDEDMDVQVLVSSKRKLVLRVVNPDEAESVRQRTPSQ